MKTLELFNAVMARKGGSYELIPELGILIEPSASHAAKAIKAFYRQKLLDGWKLNQTFHKSWKKVQNSSREELLIHQLIHYATTYGTGHQSEFVYIPDEKLEIPEKKLSLMVVRGLTKKELSAKCLDLFASGVALKSETITDVLWVLDDVGYKFTGKEDIKNKEALMHICDEANVVPQDPVECVRYLVYKTTGDTLLIKNAETYAKIATCQPANAIKASRMLAKMNECELAKVFNRFKPIFLALKKVLGENGKKSINKISRLSKTLHEPLKDNILNRVGTCTVKELQSASLQNANFFQLARAIQFLRQGQWQTKSVFSVRNGKSYAKDGGPKIRKAEKKISILMGVVSRKFDLSDLKVFIPDYVKYALPTSEKNFVGHVPTGTKFSAKSLAMGVYWENSGGARDLDLSGMSESQRIGWNSDYSGDSVTYSGDMTDASNGAVEYIRVSKKSLNPHIIMNNVYSGEAKGSKFKIVLGKGSKVSKDFMMNPNKVWFSADAETIQKQSVVGLMGAEDGKAYAVVLNMGSGNIRVASHSVASSSLRTALIEKWTDCFYINELLEACGATLVDDPVDADVDLTPEKLERDSILSLFSVDRK